MKLIKRDMSKAMSNKEQNVTSNIDPEIVKSNRILSLSGGGVKGIAEWHRQVK